MQPKKIFSIIDYQKCDPQKCDPEAGICAAAKECSHKVIQQLDGAFEQPVLFHELCMGCWDCIDACSLNAIARNQTTT